MTHAPAHAVADLMLRVMNLTEIVERMYVRIGAQQQRIGTLEAYMIEMARTTRRLNKALARPKTKRQRVHSEATERVQHLLVIYAQSEGSAALDRIMSSSQDVKSVHARYKFWHWLHVQNNVPVNFIAMHAAKRSATVRRGIDRIGEENAVSASGT